MGLPGPLSASEASWRCSAAVSIPASPTSTRRGCTSTSFDTIDTVDIIDCNAGSHGQPFATNFNPEINIREITSAGAIGERCVGKHRPPVVEPNVRFPKESADEDLPPLPRGARVAREALPDLRRARFWMTFSENYLTTCACWQCRMTRIDAVRFQGQDIVPIQFLKALLPDPASLGPLTKGRTCIGVLAHGREERQGEGAFVYNICDHEACYREVKSQAISYTTGVPPRSARK